MSSTVGVERTRVEQAVPTVGVGRTITGSAGMIWSTGYTGASRAVLTGHFSTSEQTSVRHRVGRSVDVMTPSEAVLLPPRLTTQSQEKRIQNQLNLCVKRETVELHVKWWKLWRDFASSRRHDLYLRTSDGMQRVVTVGIFFCYLLDSGRSLSHINLVIRAMKFFFVQALIDISFLDHEVVARLENSAKPVGRQAIESRQSRKKEPLTFDMLQWVRCNYRLTLDDRMVY